MQVKHPNRVRVVRERKGLSMSEVSRRANISLSHLFHIEHGRADASVSIGRRIAAVLETTLDELFPPFEELDKSA